MLRTIVDENINIPGAPEIPGLRFRHYQGETDLPKIVTLDNLVNQTDQTGEVETLEQLRHNYQHLKNCDPYKDVILGELNGEFILYSRVSWVQEDDSTFVYRLFGNIHPDWRGKGLGTAVLPYNENRLREIALENSHNGDQPRIYESFSGSTMPGTNALLERMGYEIVRYFYEMTRPIEAHLPEAPMPKNLEVRPFEEVHNRPIWEAIDEAFRDHWGAVAGTEEDYKRFLGSPNRKPHLWKVAWEGDEVAGMVLNTFFEHENREFNIQRGWTDPICVRRRWRRRGLGRALIVQSIQMFREMGFDETALGVDANNPNHALNLYEGVGYQTDKTWMAYRKPVE